MSLLLYLIMLHVSLYCFPPYTFCCPSTYSISSLLVCLCQCDLFISLIYAIEVLQ